MPGLKVRIGCVVLAVAMSAVTYYFVEPRLRWGRYVGYKAAGLLSLMAVMGVAGYSVERHDGYTARMDDPEQAVIDAINKRIEGDGQRCLDVISDWKKLSENLDITQCRFQRPMGKNTIAIIGDSHGGHLYAGLTAQTKEKEGVVVFPAACAIPLIGLHSSASPDDIKTWHTHVYTEHLLSEGFNYILSHDNIKKVVLAHRPGCSFEDVVDKYKPENHDFERILRDGFARTYDALTKAGKEIYVVLDNPFRPGDLLKCKSSVVIRPVGIPVSLSKKKFEVCTAKQSDLVERRAVDNWGKVSKEMANGYNNINFINLEQFFCKNGTCSMLDSKDNLLYRDEGHLNIKGSIYVAPFIMDILRLK